MRNYLFGLFALTFFFGVFWVVLVNAQTDLVGKYVFAQKLDNGQTNLIAFDLKSENVAVYSKINESLEQSEEKTGSWVWDKSKKLLTITMPGNQSAERADEKEVILTFILADKNLKVVKVLPASAGQPGDVFKKLY